MQILTSVWEQLQNHCHGGKKAGRKKHLSGNTTLEEKTTHLKSLIILEMIRILTTRNLEFKKNL